MNWLQKVAVLDRFANFFLIEGELIWGDTLGYHADYLRKRYGLPPFFANLFRGIFPRGAASYDMYDNNRLIIEMSSELKSYIPELIERWNLTAQDRPKWVFDESHYIIRKDRVEESVLEYMMYEDLDENTMNFIQKFLPELYGKIANE